MAGRFAEAVAAWTRRPSRSGRPSIGLSWYSAGVTGTLEMTWEQAAELQVQLDDAMRKARPWMEAWRARRRKAAGLDDQPAGTVPLVAEDGLTLAEHP